MDLGARVASLLQRHPSVRAVTLVGSRAGGEPTELSDWDLEVDVDDPEPFEAALPTLLEELRPLAGQWDRLGDHRNYMIMLPGPVKIDIIIERPQEESGPWEPSASTLRQIDHHFWDWTLWLGSKTLRGKDELVTSELRKMGGHLLGPLGADPEVETLGDAIDTYRAARDRLEATYDVRVDRRMDEQVSGALERARVLS